MAWKFFESALNQVPTTWDPESGVELLAAAAEANRRGEKAAALALSIRGATRLGRVADTIGLTKMAVERFPGKGLGRIGLEALAELHVRQ